MTEEEKRAIADQAAAAVNIGDVSINIDPDTANAIRMAVLELDDVKKAIAKLNEIIAKADEAAAGAHRHYACGAADCEENHEELGSVTWQAWDGSSAIGTASDDAAKAVYVYLENDLTITDTLDITNVTVYLCLNGKTLTIDKPGYPAVRVGENQKFVLCDCKNIGNKRHYGDKQH